MPLLCLGSATVSLTTYVRSLDLRQRCSRSTTSSIRSYYLNYSTTIVCPDKSVNYFRCLPDLVVLVVPIFSNICVEENVNSKTISQYLSSNIVLQNHTQAPGRGDCIQDQRRKIANQREPCYKSLLDNLSSSMSEEQLRANDLAQQKGSSAWLTALPLADEGYVLTKREFYDAIYLRYRWQLKRIPSYCAHCNLACRTGAIFFAIFRRARASARRARSARRLFSVACRTGFIFLRFSGERGQARGEREVAAGYTNW